MQDFGTRLRSLRRGQELSLDELAARTGISKAYLWKLEKKPGVNPSLDIVQKLADALGTTVNDLAQESAGKQKHTLNWNDYPQSLRECWDKYQDTGKITTEDIRELATIRFRGGHPTTADGWYSLFLQLKQYAPEPRD